MKVAIILRGVSFQENYLHHTGFTYTIDWKINRDNIISNKKDLIDCGHNVDMFYVTYEHGETNEMCEFFHPQKYILKPYSRETSQISLILECLEAHETLLNLYDVVLLSRFDVNIIMDKCMLVETLQKAIANNKIYLPFKEFPGKGLVGDCIVVIPTTMIGYFRHSLERLKNDKENTHNSMHMLLSVIDSGHVDFISEEMYDSNTDNMPNPIYTINRQIPKNIPGILTKCLKHIPRGLKKHKVNILF